MNLPSYLGQRVCVIGEWPWFVHQTMDYLCYPGFGWSPRSHQNQRQTLFPPGSEWPVRQIRLRGRKAYSSLATGEPERLALEVHSHLTGRRVEWAFSCETKSKKSAWPYLCQTCAATCGWSLHSLQRVGRPVQKMAATWVAQRDRNRALLHMISRRASLCSCRARIPLGSSRKPLPMI